MTISAAPELYDVLQKMKSVIFSSLRVSLPGSISKINADGTVNVKVGIMQNIPKQDTLSGLDVSYPELTMCPVFSLQGGGVGSIMPVAVNDECLVVFSDRCIESWFSTGQAMPLPDFRMHNLADGFVLVGLNSLVNPLVTPLLTNEGGICETKNVTGAKVTVNTLTHLVDIANGAAGINNLGTLITELATELATINDIVATMTTATIAAGTPQGLAITNGVAIAASLAKISTLLKI